MCALENSCKGYASGGRGAPGGRGLLTWERKGCHPLTKQYLGPPERVRAAAPSGAGATPSWEQLSQLLNCQAGGDRALSGLSPPTHSQFSSPEEDLLALAAACERRAHAEEAAVLDQSLDELADFFGMSEPGGLD